jgi:phage/plasmid-like protein (TIGR03299 family)
MAHELSIRTNGKAEMAFVGETPWHGLGQSVTKGASIGVWMKEAGMDWEAKETVVQYADYNKPSPQLGLPVMRKVESHKVLYRSDTGEPLGIVGRDYKVVQPAQVLEFFREMTEEQGWYIHTAGVLRGGRKLWAMATNGEVETIGGKKGDQVINQLLFATSLDASMKTVVKECSTVVVCANTMAVALREKAKGVVVSHRSVFDERAVKRSLGLARGEYERFLHHARMMSEEPIVLDEALDILNGIFGVVKKEAKAKPTLDWVGGDLSYLNEVAEAEPEEQEARSVGRVLELFNGAGLGANKPGRRQTKWGLFNAVTQYVDHEMGRTLDTRMDSAWFGRGESFKEEAFKALAGADA